MIISLFMTDFALETQKTKARRLLGLAAVARLAMFARHEGPAVLICTQDRLELFQDTGAFGVPHSLNPDITNWHDKFDKVVISLEHAFRPFPKNPHAYALSFELTKDYPRETLLETFINYGYERDAQPGFSVLGDTITLFFDEEDPEDSLRLEFFGDELDRMERKQEAKAGLWLESFVLAPRFDTDIQDDAWDSKLIEHLEGHVFLDTSELFAGDVGEDAATWLWQFLANKELTSFGRDPLELSEESLPVDTLGYYRGRLADFHNDLDIWLQDGYSVTLLLKFERTGRYLKEKIVDDLEAHFHNTVRFHAAELGLVIAPNAKGGFRDSEAKEIILTEELLYGAQGARKLKKTPGKRVHDAVQLTIGDYLIHPDHGIARFMGLEPRQVLGVTRDYLMMQFAGEGKLYLPVEFLPLLRRHPGTTDDPPRLSTLGTNEWARARERARINAQALAAELIKTYAARQVAEGVSMPAIADWDPLIQANCPFVLTKDQAEAIDAVWADMARDVPMDRLISGDVGFGKTEVAVRSAHRAVGNGKQVALLVPTTVLSRQHFETFKERFEGIPVRIEMLSRFVNDKDAREIIKGIKEGSVDIIIGTHRLLNESIKFKDLGLLIIDEEHRFGVAQKEKMKALQANLDVLSLSATPIPRTLYMSLVGLRDVSQIMTPPSGRKPIQTLLQPYEALAAREAIMFELERGGKIFYIHDRVGSMGMRAKTLQQLVPEARIGVAHGQMAADDLEAIMTGFEEGAFDILLATTIVESGLDITGANTLIIERADKLGLAQLYQLRGRVGRRQTEAWAHLFYPGRITEQAQRRLYAIAELNDLGSGHLLAEKDMEIRGVGNLLGPEQHGQIAAVSLEVYTEMLAEEIAKLKGEKIAEGRVFASIDISLDARISPSYITSDDMRIEYYGRLSETTSLAKVTHVAKEMRERYGPIPAEVKAFIDLAKLRLLASDKGAISIKEHMTDIQIIFEKESLDYDARGLKNLPYSVEVTRYPVGFSIKKRGLHQEKQFDAINRVLYLCA